METTTIVTTITIMGTITTMGDTTRAETKATGVTKAMGVTKATVDAMGLMIIDLLHLSHLHSYQIKPIYFLWQLSRHQYFHLFSITFLCYVIVGIIF